MTRWSVEQGLAWIMWRDGARVSETGDGRLGTILPRDTAQAPVLGETGTDEIERVVHRGGQLRADGADPCQRTDRADANRRLAYPALPIERNQARRLRVLLLDHAGARTIRVEPIEKPCQQDGDCAVDAIDIRQVDLDEAASVEPWWNILHGPGHRRRMGQVERTGRHETRPVSFTVCSDGDWHGQILFQLDRPDGQRLFMRLSAYKLDLSPRPYLRLV